MRSTVCYKTLDYTYSNHKRKFTYSSIFRPNIFSNTLCRAAVLPILASGKQTTSQARCIFQPSYQHSPLRSPSTASALGTSIIPSVFRSESDTQDAAPAQLGYAKISAQRQSATVKLKLTPFSTFAANKGLPTSGYFSSFAQTILPVPVSTVRRSAARFDHGTSVEQGETT